MHMSVDIPVEFQQFVQSAVESGGFRSESEVVGEALRLLQLRQARLALLKEQIGSALAQLDRGESIELDDESLRAYFDDVKSRGRKNQEGEEQDAP
jgi:antitoxin ParD1/3/4